MKCIFACKWVSVITTNNTHTNTPYHCREILGAEIVGGKNDGRGYVVDKGLQYDKDMNPREF